MKGIPGSMTSRRSSQNVEPAGSASNSVGKTVRVLAAVAAAGGFGRLTEIAESAGVPKASAHRILATLVAEGFVILDASRRYGAGTRLRALAANVLGSEEHGIEAVLQELQAEVRHSVHLAVLSGDQATITYRVDAGHAYQIAWNVGMRLPLHSTAAGKVILGCLPQAEVEAILARTGLPAHTTETITEQARLHAHLEEVRSQGYALDLTENDEVICAIAAPIRTPEGRPLGAVSVASLTPITPSRELRALAPVVQAAAENVARRS